MSDVNTAAEAMGIPSELVSRSAAARAQASGTTTEEVLAAWGGGEAVATKTPEPEETAAAETPAEEPPEEAAPAETREPAEPAPLEMPSAPPSEPAPPTAPARTAPPILIGASDNPWAIVVGAFGLFVAMVLLALVGPSIPADAPGSRSSAISFSEAALHGQDIYASLGCASCHTQMIRPVIADVGLGPVTLNDTNQVLGTRRYGPDLSEVGSRVSGTQLESIIGGSAGHPAHRLSPQDMSSLIAYLLESSTANIGGQE